MQFYLNGYKAGDPFVEDRASLGGAAAGGPAH